MIRFLLAVLLLQFSLTMVSCTTGDAPDSAMEGISDSDLGEGDSGAADTAAAPTDDSVGNEDELDAELESGPVAQAAPEEAAPEAEPAESDTLDAELDTQELDAEPAAPADQLQAEELQPAPEAPVAPPVAQKAKITNIRYLANANGGTVVIESSQPVTYQSRMNPATQQFIIDVADVELPANLQRPYNMKEFGSRFGGMNAYQSPGSTTARVVIQMSGGAGEPMVQQEGASLVVIPPTQAAVASAEPLSSPSAPQASTAPKEGALAARTLDEFLTGNQRFYGRPISLQVKDADVRDVINFLAEESGSNIVMSDDVTGKISLKLRKIPWDQALVTIMRSKSLGYVRQGNVLRVSTMKSLQADSDAASRLIESQKAIVPAVVQVIPISYASVEDMQKAVTPFLTKDGKVVTDARSSTLIVTDKGEVVERVAKLIKTLDIAPAQVSIESKIVEAVEGFENFVGVNWGVSGGSTNLSPTGGSKGAPIDMTLGLNSFNVSPEIAKGSPFSAMMNVGVLDVFGNLTAMLTLLEKDSLAKVISAPRISAINREKSTIIQQGENVAVVQTRNEQTNTVTKTEKRTPFRLQLEVTPQITADGGVIMDLDVQREFLGPVLDQETRSQAVNMRKAKTKVLVRNGQTAVIGGIYTSDEAESNSGVPGLKNIPVLGWLFRAHSISRNKNELLIFLTPRILSADHGAGEQNASL